MAIFAQTSSLLSATWSNYLVDIIILLFMAGLTILCAKRGFVECVFDFASTLVSFFVAVLLAKFVIFITGGLFGFQNWLENAFSNTFLKLEGFDAVLSEDGAKNALLDKNVAGIVANLAVRWFAKGKVADGTTVAQLLGGITAKLFTLLITSVVLFVVAKLLNEKKVYSDIVAATGASTATISRVNRSLQYGCNGYEEIFKRMEK